MKKHSGAGLKSVGATKHNQKMSSRHHKDIGSGSRPTKSKTMTPVSAAANPQMLDGRGKVPHKLT